MSLYKLDSLDDEDKAFLGMGKPAAASPSFEVPSAPGGLGVPTLNLRNPNDRQKQQIRLAQRRVRKMQRIATVEERLDEDFLSTPWRIPSVEAAKEYKFAEVYRGGESNMAAVNVTAAAELGVGVRMYFQFIKSMGVALLLMTLLTVPLIAFALKGNGISLEDQDPLSLYRFSLGNVGNPSVKFSSDDYTLNATIATFYGQTFSYGDASFLITLCEVLQIIIFLIVILHLKRKLHQFNNQELTKNTVSVTSYAIYVENLPEEVNEEELVKHFSDLYPLDKQDWKKRPPVEDSRPVQNCDNTGDPIYVNTWVAECILHRAIGDLIVRYKSNEELLKSLYRLRAKMKMYARDTSHVGGYNEKKFLKAEEKMLVIAQKVDHYNYFGRIYFQEKLDKMKEKVKRKKEKEKKKAEKLKNQKKKSKNDTKKKPLEKAKSQKLDLGLDDDDEPKKDVEEGKAGETKAGSLEDDLDSVLKSHESKGGDDGTVDNSVDLSAIMNQSETSEAPIHLGGTMSPRYTYSKRAPIVGAFIIFEYNESFARCIEDYSKYSSFPYSFFYPENLKFKGKKLKVTRALEPDQILWENLEVPNWYYDLLRYRTFFFTIVVIIICFFIILIVSGLRLSYSNQIPSDQLCTNMIPQLYVPDTSKNYESYFPKVSFVRPKPLEQKLYDANCSRYISNSIYAIFAENNNINNPIANYSFDACIFLPYDSRNTLLSYTPEPSVQPTSHPTSPTFSPTYFPTSKPSISQQPTFMPTAVPTTDTPSFAPSTATPTTSSPSTVAPTVARRRRQLSQSIYEEEIFYKGETFHSDFNYSYCPNYQQRTFCPCLSMDDPISLTNTQGIDAQEIASQQSDCSSLFCQLSAANLSTLTTNQYNLLQDGINNAKDNIQNAYTTCDSFSTNTPGYCYCKQIISDSRTFFQSLQHFLHTIQFWQKSSDKETILQQSQIQRDENFCQSFTQLLVLSYAVTFASIIIIVLVNSVLRYILVLFTSHERHKSIDEEQKSIFSKLFFSTYINTCIIILLAYGVKLEYVNGSVQIRRGEYVDFIRAWYGNNGYYFVTTVFLTMIQPIVVKYFMYSIYYPIRRYFAHKDIKEKKGHSIVMQYDLNQLEVGPAFLPTIPLAELLSLLFMAMTFAAGLPLLTPIAFIGFVMYFRLDKYYLGKCYRKPSTIDDRIIKLAISYLPYAAILRCIFAIWMLSSNHILPANFPVHHFLFHLPNNELAIKKTTSNYLDFSYLNMSYYKNFLNSLSTTYQSMIPKSFLFIYKRIMRMNTFPMFVLLILILICLFIEYNWHLLPLKWYYEWISRRSLVTKKKNMIFETAKAKGHVHPFDLIITCVDPLRVEAAPYTGIYYQFLTKNKVKAEEELRPKSFCEKFCCCFACCCRKKKGNDDVKEGGSKSVKAEDVDLDDEESLDELDKMEEGGGVNFEDGFDPNNAEGRSSFVSFCEKLLTGKLFKKMKFKNPLVSTVTASTKHRESNRKKYIQHWDQADGWEITDMGFDFEVKVKVWSGKRAQSPDPYGNTRMKGQHKKTFEVISDFRCNTYHMSGIPNYVLVYTYLYSQDIDINGNIINPNLVNGTRPSSPMKPIAGIGGPSSPVPGMSTKGAFFGGLGGGGDPNKIQSLVDYYVKNWKQANGHKFFDPKRIEDDLAKFDAKIHERKQVEKRKANNRILPGADDDDEEDKSPGSPGSPKLKKAGSVRSNVTFEDDASRASEEKKNEDEEGSNTPKNKKKKPVKPKQKRTFVIDEDEEEEDEEDDDEEESSEEGSSESSTEDSSESGSSEESESSGESESSEESSEEEESEEDEEEEEESKTGDLQSV